MKALNEFLRPEFINRVDEIICFNSLTEADLRRIAVLMLGEVKDAMAEKGIAFHYEESVPDYLVNKGYSVTYGARNLRRLIQKEVEDAVAAEMIDRRKGKVTDVTVSAVDGKIVVDAK